MKSIKMSKKSCKEICGGFGELGENDSFEKNSVSDDRIESIYMESKLMSDNKLKKQLNQYFKEYFTTYTDEAAEKIKTISNELKSRRVLCNNKRDPF